ncbi:MAG: uroporphyrinogen decarboxylase family protein [Planctomycetota bacterium]
MNDRERMVATLKCEKTDRAPFIPLFGPWGATLERWKKEGLPDNNWQAGIGFDRQWEQIPVNLGYSPAFKEEVVEDRGDVQIWRDALGILKLDRKDRTSMPQFLEYPVKGREDWEKLKAERLDPDAPARFPADWAEKVRRWQTRNHALVLGYYPYGVLGTPRNMMGAEEFLISLHTQSDLVKDMMNYLSDFWIVIYEKVTAEVEVDIIHIWEDMCSRNGSLISGKMFREFMAPCYRKIKAFAKNKGITLLSVDSDGDVRELVPWMMETGVNVFWPFEVQAGCDIREYRRQHPKLGILGGLDKRALAKGKDEMEAELKRAEEMLKRPGYVPALDHLVPPDVSLENYRHFMGRLKEIIGA